MKKTDRFAINKKMLKYALIFLLSCLVLWTYQQQKEIDTLKDQQVKLGILLKKYIVSEPQENFLQNGTAAPEFSLLTTDSLLYGTKQLSNLHTPKVLIFSSTHCPYCQDFYPEIQEFTKNNPMVPVVLIQDQSSVRINKEFLKNNSYDFTVLVGDDAVFEDYHIEGTPTTVILNANQLIDTTAIINSSNELSALIK